MDYAKIKALAERATCGPWLHDKAYCSVSDQYDAVRIADTTVDENAAFIAACDPTTVLGMIAEIDALRAEVATLRERARVTDEDDVALRGEVIALRARAEKAEASLAEARRERDEARADLATMTRLYERACDAVEARPAITDEMAREVAEAIDQALGYALPMSGPHFHTEDAMVLRRAQDALRSHAAKVVPR